MNQKIINPKKRNRYFLFIVGIGFLFLAKINNLIKGYKTPRQFSIKDYQKATRYDADLIKDWLEILKNYKGKNADFKDKVILELGPGQDLGVGIMLLMNGAREYNSLDVHDLSKFTPDDFYKELFLHLKNEFNVSDAKIRFLENQLVLAVKGKKDKLNCVCKKDFDITIFETGKIDLVLSQAAFEHFDDVAKTISQLSKVVKKGAILIAQVDLTTHTRWIRTADDLNIYRYPDWLYNLLKFRGSPNRLRPRDYKYFLEQNGWANVKMAPIAVLDKNYFDETRIHLAKKFRQQENNMDWLNVVVCATKR